MMEAGEAHLRDLFLGKAQDLGELAAVEAHLFTMDLQCWVVLAETVEDGGEDRLLVAQVYGQLVLVHRILCALEDCLEGSLHIVLDCIAEAYRDRHITYPLLGKLLDGRFDSGTAQRVRARCPVPSPGLPEGVRTWCYRHNFSRISAMSSTLRVHDAEQMQENLSELIVHIC